MPQFNLSGSFNFLRLFVNPTLCLPHHTISTFDQLPIPLSKAFDVNTGEKQPDIRAVVLDKDNCFAVPYENNVHGPYKSKFEELRAEYPGSRLLIVSNSTGTASDKHYAEADLLERNTGVKVLHHSTKKPGCHGEIMSYFRGASDADVSSPSQVAVVGDRLFTDVMMANMMGSYGVWIKEGVVPDNGLVRISLLKPLLTLTKLYVQLTRLERGLSGFLQRRGHVPPQPRSDFE
jgi:phosphatidylglycerophosphatase GEP4